jgi:molybdate transport system substrate-binding protein
MVVCTAVSAGDVTVVSTVGVQGVIDRVKQDFERGTSHRLFIKYGTAAVLKRQLDGGEPFDVAILTPPMIEDLARQGKISGTATTVAKTGVGVAVKAGAARPRIDTRDSLRTTILASSGIAYTKEGQSGAATARLIDALGIAEDMKVRTYLDPRPAGGLLAVTEGKATLAFALMSEIAGNSEVELVGPLPADVQTYVVFAAGVASATKEPDASRAFIAFLRTPEVLRELRKLGMEGE